MNDIIDIFEIIIISNSVSDNGHIFQTVLRSKNGNLTNLACGLGFGKTVKCGFGKMRIEQNADRVICGWGKMQIW